MKPRVDPWQWSTTTSVIKRGRERHPLNIGSVTRGQANPTAGSPSGGGGGGLIATSISTLAGGTSSNAEFLLATLPVPAGSFQLGSLARLMFGFTVTTNGAPVSYNIWVKIGGLGGSTISSLGDTCADLSGGHVTAFLHASIISVVSDVGAGTMKNLATFGNTVFNGQIQVTPTIYQVVGNFGGATTWTVSGQASSVDPGFQIQATGATLEIQSPLVTT